MNLYWCYPKEEQWGSYCFAETGGKAKAMCHKHFEEPVCHRTFTDWTAWIIEKDVPGKSEVCDSNCERLEQYKRRYASEEEMEEIY